MADKNPSPGLSMLLIDDEPFYYNVLKKSLTAAGYGFIDVASTGEIALEKVHANHYDVIVTDLRLPEMDGFEIIKRLRQDPKLGHTPVLVITAKNDPSEKQKVFALGADDYLAKPIQPQELIARIDVLLRRRGPTTR